MIHPAPKPRSTKKPRRAVKKVNAARKRREFARAYHSVERVEWVKTLRCIASPLTSCEGEIQNAHTENGGMRRKGHFSTIVPLCSKHHSAFDERRSPLTGDFLRGVFRSIAAAIEDEWQEHMAGRAA